MSYHVVILVAAIHLKINMEPNTLEQLIIVPILVVMFMVAVSIVVPYQPATSYGVAQLNEASLTGLNRTKFFKDCGN